jgi:hypothetical protein
MSLGGGSPGQRHQQSRSGDAAQEQFSKHEFWPPCVGHLASS